MKKNVSFDLLQETDQTTCTRASNDVSMAIDFMNRKPVGWEKQVAFYLSRAVQLLQEVEVKYAEN